MKTLTVMLAALPALALANVPDDVLNHDVRQDTIRETICVSGYTKAVRPSTNYTNSVKKLLMKR
ncbi:hypothetical protein E4K72_10545 [Oxalobacteraceae bacterium OM1]|nr:hypothetical protein E4K72_10545 [Oxalobacteraceae bacterium OM1]